MGQFGVDLEIAPGAAPDQLSATLTTAWRQAPGSVHQPGASSRHTAARCQPSHIARVGDAAHRNGHYAITRWHGFCIYAWARLPKAGSVISSS